MPVEVALIGFDSVLSVLRWLALAFLCFLVILLFIKSKRLETSRPAIIALVVTVIAAPFLIFDLISPKATEPNEPAEPVNPTPVEPIPDKEPEPETKPETEEIDPISYITPAVPKKKTPRGQGGNSKTDDTTPVVPDIPVEPEDMMVAAYLVVNRKMDIEGEKFEVEEVEKFDGIPGDVVTVAVKNYKGFTAPAAKTFTLEEDTRKMVVYNYDRNKYSFSLGDEANTTSSLPAGNYYYGTEITLSAKTRSGYNFMGWSNGEQDQDIVLTLEEDTEITPIYEKGPNSVYTVTHKRQNMNGEYGDEELTVIEELEAKTDTTVIAAVKEYAGFKTPTAQSVLVTIDDAAEVTYYYERESYDFTLDNLSQVEYKTHDSGNYYYGTEITVRASRINPGKVFKQWSNGVTTLEYSFTLTGETVLEPEYEDSEDMPTVFKIEGECQFNGILPSNTNKQMTETNPISGDGCADAHENFVGQDAINTHVKLFSEENINKDFVVNVDIVEFDTSKNALKSTLIGGTLEKEYDDNRNRIQWPGIVLRRNEATDQFLVGSNTTYWKTTTSAVRGNGTKKYHDIATTKRVTIVRKQGTICYAVKNDYSDGYGTMTKMNKQDATKAYTFDHELHFGASYETVNDEMATTKYINGTLKNLEIRVGTDTAGELASCR